LHPGNIFVDAEGNYVLLDTGLVSEIPDYYVRKYFRVSLAMVFVDGRLIGEAYLEGHEIPEEKRQATLNDIEQLAQKYKGKSFFEVNEAHLILEIFGVLRRHHIYLDPEWTALILSDVTFEGIAMMIDKQTDFMAVLGQKLPTYASYMSFLSTDDLLVQMCLQRKERD
jgi:ubiquinone biosynthesis protein